MKPLDKLINRSSNLAKADLKGMVTDSLVKVAEEVIWNNYPDASFDLYRKGNNNVLSATAEGLWFREFGTGYPGEGTYPDESVEPFNTPLTFTTSRDPSQPNQQWTTPKWTYHYHPLTASSGQWYWGKPAIKWFGLPAQAGVYKAYREIKTNQKQIVIKCLRSIGK